MKPFAELGFDETAAGITKSLLKKFEEDGILNTVRKNMVAFVSGKMNIISNQIKIKPFICINPNDYFKS